MCFQTTICGFSRDFFPKMTFRNKKFEKIWKNNDDEDETCIFLCIYIVFIESEHHALNQKPKRV